MKKMHPEQSSNDKQPIKITCHCLFLARYWWLYERENDFCVCEIELKKNELKKNEIQEKEVKRKSPPGDPETY